MDMEVDIPAAEELEWLESNALLEDPGEEEFEELEGFVEGTLVEQPASPDRAMPVDDGDEITRKRHWSEEEGLSCEKRKRKEQEVDEDWLRYSPPEKSVEGDFGVGVPSVVEEKVIYRYASEIDGECIPVTSIDGGDRVYAKVSRWVENDDRRGRLNFQIPSTGLLAEPIDVMMDKLEQEAFAKAVEASSMSTSDGGKQPEACIVSEKLWVEKYAPNSFSELLSDEQTNREVLLWLKQWDSHVFGSQVRATADDVLSALRRYSSVPQSHSGRSFSTKKFLNGRNSFSKNTASVWSNHIGSQSNSSSQKDRYQKSNYESWHKKSVGDSPPEQKILLLCGPPGLGKTTLAHVAAKHCGYRVVEINASDHRTSSMIESKIHDAVLLHSVMADSKPKCLIIDEIDGALAEGKGAVEVILKMVASEKKPSGKENVSEDAKLGKKQSKKSTSRPILSRPVICICNDLFAPAIRPLRQIARVHMFVQPTVNRVTSRLNYICNEEGFNANSIALTALAEYTECDIRSCLNTLQFLNKKKERLNAMRISSQVVGHKDLSRSVFDVWKEIFQTRKMRQGKFTRDCSCSSEKMDFLYSLLSNHGDYELTMDGIHENILKLQYHDPLMQKTVKCLNSVGISDMLLQYSGRTQHMSLYVYQPSMAISVHTLISQIEKPKIEWPKSFQRCRGILVEKKELLKMWHTKIAPHISRHLCVESFVQDVITPLLKILSCPTLRPVALHLLTQKEKEDMDDLVGTMLSYELTYKNLKTQILTGVYRKELEADAPELSLDPPLTEFVNFKGYISGHLGLPSATKQVLMHEVEKQKIVRDSMSRHTCLLNGDRGQLGSQFAGGAVQSFSSEALVNRQKLNDLKKSKTMPTSTLGTKSNMSVTGLKTKAPTSIKKQSGSSNFFDRFRKSNYQISSNSERTMEKTATLERDLRPFLFKFNEGFTNAVKRPVRIFELL